MDILAFWNLPNSLFMYFRKVHHEKYMKICNVQTSWDTWNIGNFLTNDPYFFKEVFILFVRQLSRLRGSHVGWRYGEHFRVSFVGFPGPSLGCRVIRHLQVLEIDVGHVMHYTNQCWLVVNWIWATKFNEILINRSIKFENVHKAEDVVPTPFFLKLFARTHYSRKHIR